MVSRLDDRGRSWLRKKARGSGYPVGTLAFYGPDHSTATKAVAAVVPAEGASVSLLEKWFSDGQDIRSDGAVLEAVAQFLKRNQVRSVAMIDGVIGCPHEEGIDYPEEGECPTCHYWRGRDRWAPAEDPRP